jgi:lipoprotein-anchoring transpeptidase ErfK/SrfK
MKAVRIFAILFLLGSAIYTYTNILPYAYPDQYKPTTEDLAAGGYYDTAHQEGTFHGQKVLSYAIPRPDKLATQVLGDSDGADKHVEVDLTNQKVYAFEGSNKVMEFIVSTGKWGKTPTGEFRIGYKTRAQLMKGGNAALGTSYYLPNVPYVQFFGNASIPWSTGFSFHGTYWHNNFGHPMSHGCINMRTEDAEKLFYWTTPNVDGKGSVRAGDTTPGTRVVIYGDAPAA